MASEREVLVSQTRSAFRASFGRTPTHVASAPGRINLIGEHTDYNAGLALPGAIDRWMVVALAPRPDDQVTVRALDRDAQHRWTLSAPPQTGPSWARLAAGALAQTAAGGAQLTGLDALVTGTVPAGSGLSSSAALSLAWLVALAELLGVHADPRQLARGAQCIEHDWLGVQTGLLDPLAIQFARPGQVMRIDFANHTWSHHVHDLPGWRWVAAHSGVTRDLAHSAYDERVATCRLGLQALRGPQAPHHALRSVTLQELDDSAAWAPRLRHLITENARVDATATALGLGDTETVGRLLLASHRSLRDDYAVSCDALDHLVDLAAAAPGCAGARMMGGGFGGCTLNLVRTEALQDFAAALSEGFSPRWGRQPPTLPFRLVGGPRVLTESP